MGNNPITLYKIEMEFMKTMPEDWWEKQENEINIAAAAIAQETIGRIAAQIKWKHQVEDEKEVLKLLKQIERVLDMSADEILDQLIVTAKHKACMSTFEKHYSHLCLKNDAGEVLIPLSAIPTIHLRTHAETKAAIEQLQCEYPELVFAETMRIRPDLIRVIKALCVWDYRSIQLLRHRHGCPRQ